MTCRINLVLSPGNNDAPSSRGKVAYTYGGGRGGSEGDKLLFVWLKPGRGTWVTGLASGKLKDRPTASIDNYLTRRFPVGENKLWICDKECKYYSHYFCIAVCKYIIFFTRNSFKFGSSVVRYLKHLSVAFLIRADYHREIRRVFRHISLIIMLMRRRRFLFTYSSCYSVPLWNVFNPLTPNDNYSGRTASLTSKLCILYIYSSNIGTEYFKRGIYSSCFSLQNAVCFIILTYLVPVLFTFYIQGVLKLRK